MNVYVIGADTGVGEAVAQLCIDKKHNVGVGLYDYCSASYNRWKQYDNAFVLNTDVCDESGLRAAAHTLFHRFGSADIVINTAGLLTVGDRTKNIVENDCSELLRMMEVNAYGVLTVFKAFYPHMRRGALYAAVTAGGGTFLMEEPLFPAYVVSKTAANKIVQTIKNTVQDVRVCAIHPGKVNTPMGRTTAEIEPEESAAGIYQVISSNGELPFWFLNYDGSPLPI
ncbi:MAG: SDR family NAD(P)-dependent oxidoreductase [Oscillospiraceae bacterium]|nr:SDR family NAD(P)-dependent oxidoreductase [Oscillospiraceae bacterium]